MASPPYVYSPAALSPPYPSHASLPAPAPAASTTTSPSKKRPSEGASGVSPSLKRARKASTMSQASGISGAGQPTHPLRQTSFPADEDLYGYGSGQRSPSVDAMSRVSGPSGVSGTTGSVAPTEKKKRGRKSRASIAAAAAAAAAQQSQQQQSQSQERSGSPSLVGDASTANSRRGYSRSAKNGAGDTAEEEEDDAAANEVMAMEQAARTQDQKREEARLRAMLVEALDKDQYLRYENWRAARLPDSVIRRVVNATVSQSVPSNVVLAVKSVAKLFIGDLIESARRVQAEWIAAGTEPTQIDVDGREVDENITSIAGDGSRTAKELTSTREGRAAVARAIARIDDEKGMLEQRRGPLRPDHLREAWRRHKEEAEGGSVGLLGLWHAQQESGVERFAVKARGRRIFR